VSDRDRLACKATENIWGLALSIYDGVVAFDDGRIPVIVGVEADIIRLSADGTEIGEWSGDECTIFYQGDGVFVINAENESLRFLPRDPRSFAAAIDGGALLASTSTAGPATRDDPATRRDRLEARAEAPEPKRITKILFYLITAMTVALGSWALISLLL